MNQDHRSNEDHGLNEDYWLNEDHGFNEDYWLNEVFDVVVVGAGPAGSSAALAAVRAGARTLILDRAQFPRYKTCGGGLIGATLGSLPADLDVPVRQEIYHGTFSYCGAVLSERHSDTRVLSLVDRAEFDDALLRRAVDEGAVARLGVTVTAVSQQSDGVVVTTSQGELRGRYLVGADGSASRVAREVGVVLAQVDLGLEVELDAGGRIGEDWKGRIHLDWGPIRGSYAWVFPKGERLTVGVIARKGSPVETRAYLATFLRQLNLQDAKILHESGHLTRCRTADSPLGRGRILVCGDAAGLLEPWTREGISFAVRSGTQAGDVVGRASRSSNGSAGGASNGSAGGASDGSAGGSSVVAEPDVVAEYSAGVEATLAAEMRAGTRFLAAFEQHPKIMHLLLTRTSLGWRTFVRITRGDASFAHILRRRPVQLAITLLGRPFTRSR